jgi:uncharacterized protein YndB with AHSA1/START domain
MTERTVTHATFSLERTYEAPPARAFAAWANPQSLLRWGSPAEGWTTAFDRFEFRVGGSAISRFGPKGGEAYVNESLYMDIVPDARIVSADTMSSEGKRLFTGLLTVALRAAGAGCQLVLTEQGAFLDGHDIPENHKAGWGTMLDNLRIELRRTTS